ncbi:hypothetical protein AVEN_46669-1, partial [Araneus ventricosus]
CGNLSNDAKHMLVAKATAVGNKIKSPSSVGLRPKLEIGAADLTKNVDAAGESPVCSLVHRDKATEAAKQKTENNGNQGHTKEIPIK